MDERLSDEFVRVCLADEFPEGEKLLLEINDLGIVLVHCLEGFFAVEDVCTHDQAPLGEGEHEGCELICPRHGARFDARNGNATRLPAVQPIRTFPTRIVDGWIEIGLPAA